MSLQWAAYLVTRCPGNRGAGGCKADHVTEKIFLKVTQSYIINVQAWLSPMQPQVRNTGPCTWLELNDDLLEGGSTA